MKHLGIATVLAFGLLTGCSTVKVKVSSKSEASTPVAGPPVRVHVADFELLAANLKHEEGFLPAPPKPDLPLPLPLPLPGMKSDRTPEARARQIVGWMSDSLLRELRRRGFHAERLAAGAPLPTNGWLIRGTFTEVQEGNRLQRAVIGFGRGATDLQAVTSTSDLSAGPPRPLYELETATGSGKTPGAGPTLILGPYGAAARFVMAGKDLERDVKRTAAQITEELVKQARPATQPLAPNSRSNSASMTPSWLRSLEPGALAGVVPKDDGWLRRN